ncbi:hypothetical protein EJ06DRAFT_559171 [Trichodelitschia bisporula]|uniref:Serine-rich protein n=1 Tax=Trichodelitschia bisporula TaxID=703511 RepID=A0A6G1HMB3_9PEZI|nr:hypothetical protein EJ06DRAFT_559171 [Trichodelitschia bisporula]
MSTASRSPSRSPRRSPASPKRNVLHQRSDSEKNASTPTIRIVADPGAYSKSPFPSHPSQILTPYADRGRPVSDENSPANPPPKTVDRKTLVPEPLASHRHRASAASALSDDSTLIGSTSPYLDQFADDGDERARASLPPLPEDPSLESKGDSLEEKAAAPSRPTIRAVTPSNEPPLATKQSQVSLSSSTSTETITSKKRSANYVIFPSSSPPPTTPSVRGFGSGRRRSSGTGRVPALKESFESLAYSDASYTSAADRPRSSSQPAPRPDSRLQYPIVRPPSASGSWAEVSRPSTATAPRMTDVPFRVQQWSSRLSTIASESDRNSQSLDSRNSWGRRRRTIGSDGVGVLPSPSEEATFSVGSGVLTGPPSEVSIPAPLFARGRDSEEGDDTLGELQSPTLKAQRSFRFAQARESRPGSADSAQSHASQMSFGGELCWARQYYANGEPVPVLTSSSSVDVSLGRIDTATSGTTSSPTSDTFPQTIFVPRNRPRQNAPRPETSETTGTAETAETVDTAMQTDATPPQRQRSATAPSIYAPQLHRDRRTTAMYTPWRAPSLDEPFIGGLMGRTNRQVVLFCLGFLCPLMWMLGALLPLPARPAEFLSPDMTHSTTEIGEAHGQVYAHNAVSEVSLANEKRFQKARWWRNANRILSVVGLLIIGAVIALAVVATRM